MKKMKKVGLILGIILIIILATGIGLFSWMTNSAEKAMEALVFEDIDMNRVADGVYYGEADGGFVQVKVEVEVADHRIAGIKILEHKNGKGSAAEGITEFMIAENRYDVEAVSGATYSSEVIKSGVSKALKEGYL